MHPLLPIFLDLKGKSVLLVGGGAVALEKLEKLWPTGARLQLIAEHFQDATRQRLEELGIPFLTRSFTTMDLEGQFLVISAVNDPLVHASIAAAAREQRVLVNTVDAPESADFYFGAQVERGPLQIAISTRGLFPGVARALRLWLEEAFPETIKHEVNELALLRRLTQTRIPDPARRMRALREQLQIWMEKPPHAGEAV